MAELWVLRVEHDLGEPKVERLGLFDSERHAQYWKDFLFRDLRPDSGMEVTIERGNEADYSLTEFIRYQRRNDG